MCHQFNTYFTRCRHREQVLNRCASSFENYKREPKKKKRGGWFKNLFSHSSSKKQQWECDRHIISERRLEYCNACTMNRELKRREREAIIRREQAKTREEIRQASLQRFEFRCSRCRAERRNLRPEDRDPQINRGLCCARGLDEYEKYETREGKWGSGSGLLLPQYKYHPITSSQAAPRIPRKERDPASRKRSASTDAARIAAKEASRRYGWENDPRYSADISTELARDITNLAASVSRRPLSPRYEKTVENYLPEPKQEAPRKHDATRAVSSAEQSGKISPRYEEPGIDWDRWDRAPQTFHGRYPPATVPPRKPVPQRPEIQVPQPRKYFPQNNLLRDPSRQEPLPRDPLQRKPVAQSLQGPLPRDPIRRKPVPQRLQGPPPQEPLPHPPLRNQRGEVWRDSRDIMKESKDTAGQYGTSALSPDSRSYPATQQQYHTFPDTPESGQKPTRDQQYSPLGPGVGYNPTMDHHRALPLTPDSRHYRDLSPSPPSPVSPLDTTKWDIPLPARPLKSMVSRLDDSIDEALELWKKYDGLGPI